MIQPSDDDDETTVTTLLFWDHVVSLTTMIREFAQERQWSKFHQPRNLLFALLGEVGELCEIFQWKTDACDAHLTLDEMDKARQELADVAIYLLRLADVCGMTEFLQAPSSSSLTKQTTV